MSKQLIDSIYRIFDKTVLQAEKEQHKKALENLAKAEKLSEKANRPDLLCQTLMLKGRALFALNINCFLGCRLCGDLWKEGAAKNKNRFL
jgi:hypothetical protein